MRRNIYVILTALAVLTISGFATGDYKASGNSESCYQKGVTADEVEGVVIPEAEYRGEKDRDPFIHVNGAWYGGEFSFDMDPKEIIEYGGIEIANYRWIKYEDAWYWETYAGPYQYQMFHWEDLSTAFVYLKGRYANSDPSEVFSIWAWDNPNDEWDQLGTTSGGNHYSFDAKDYVLNGNLTVLVYYGSYGYWTMWNSYVHLSPYAIIIEP